jgi:hypothetical protein
VTTVDILYRYDTQPSEAAAMALSRLREVYGIRSVELNEAEKTVRIEYDATRLTAATVFQLIRRAGVLVAAEVSLLAPEVPAEAAPAAS